MKKTLLLAMLTVLLAGVASAQKDTVIAKPKHHPLDRITGNGFYNRDSTWKIGGFVGVTVSQTALYQWAPGGSNNFSFLAAASGYANYKKKNVEWSNNLDIKYGEVANGLIRDAGLATRNFQKNISMSSNLSKLLRMKAR